MLFEFCLNDNHILVVRESEIFCEKDWTCHEIFFENKWFLTACILTFLAEKRTQMQRRQGWFSRCLEPGEIPILEALLEYSYCSSIIYRHVTDSGWTCPWYVMNEDTVLQANVHSPILTNSVGLWTTITCRRNQALYAVCLERQTLFLCQVDMVKQRKWYMKLWELKTEGFLFGQVLIDILKVQFEKDVVG